MISDAELARVCEWVTGEDERHVAVIDDGWRLARYRYRGAGRPVLCGHGGLASPTHLYPLLDRFLQDS